MQRRLCPKIRAMRAGGERPHRPHRPCNWLTPQRLRAAQKLRITAISPAIRELNFVDTRCTGISGESRMIDQPENSIPDEVTRLGRPLQVHPLRTTSTSLVLAGAGAFFPLAAGLCVIIYLKVPFKK